MSKSDGPWYENIIGWLKDVVPTGIALLMAVFNYMKQRVIKEKIKTEKVKLQKRFLENEKEINKDFANKSDIDAIKFAIERGSEIQDED